MDPEKVRRSCCDVWLSKDGGGGDPREGLEGRCSTDILAASAITTFMSTLDN